MSDPTYTILSSSNGKCDSSGKESIDLTVEVSEELQGSVSFQISLLEEQNNNPITADCPYNVEEVIEGGRLRRLSAVTYIFTCSFDSPNEAGKYAISPVSESVGLKESSINVELLHCISEEIAIARNIITLSYRQVNNFEISSSNQVIFSFYGLTGSYIGTNYQLTLNAYLIEGETRESEPTIFECTAQKKASSGDSYAPVPFQCISSEISKNTYTSLEIASSDSIAGIPLDNILLNPVLTANAIANGQLYDLSNSPSPAYTEPGDFDYSKIEDGIIQFIIYAPDVLPIEKKEFTIHLLYPSGIILNFTVPEVSTDEGDVFEAKIECRIIGKVEAQKLYIEQTVVRDGKDELFVFPAISTDEITTNGYSLPSDENEEEEHEKEQEEEHEKEQEEESKKEEKETELFKEFEKEQQEKENEFQKLFEESEKELSQEFEQEQEENFLEKEKEEIVAENTYEASTDEISDSVSSIVDTTEITQATTSGGNGTEVDTSEGDEEEEEEDKPMIKEEAEKRPQLFISFRQMNTFAFKPGTISFNLLVLTTQPLTKGDTITLKVNLIGNDGMDDEPTEIECTLQSDVAEPSEGESSQGNYKCELSGLDTSKTYTSVRLYSSDDVAGIPTNDETALNPALTDEAIKNGEVKDYSTDSSVPPTFSFEEIDTTNCPVDGKFVIKGSISGDKEIVANKFTIPLTYPEGTSITCNFVDKNIECIADKELNESIILEQTIVSEGPEEICLIRNLSSDDMNCKNGLMAKAEEKAKVDISFRQVSNIKAIPNGLSFFFAALVKVNLEAGHTIPMNVFVIINGKKVEKEANCTLREAVTTSGTPVQGDFDCVVSLESNETVAPEDLTVSKNNDDIGGCSELTKEEASPKLTDDAIEETKNKPDLGKVLDFSLPENKGKTPATFEVTAMDLDKCEKKGKIKVTGKFAEDIKEEKTFEIPFTFPAYKIKCTVDPVAKDTSTDIICKTQKTKKFFGFKSLILEPRLLKKKKMEMFYIKHFKQEERNEMFCDNYNEIRLKRVKAKRNAHFTFLQMARPPSYKHLFFIALMKKSSETPFENREINVSLIITKNSKRRILDTLDLTDELEVSCTVGNTTSDAGALDCSDSTISSDSNATMADVEDSDVGGSTDDVKVKANPNPDYSQMESLKSLDELATVEITDIQSNRCSSTGTYTITGKLTGKLNESLSLDNITIPFSTPDSSGLCKISGDSTLTMKCENTEEFTVSQITVPAQVINDKLGNPLFRITKDYTASTQFACTISENSTKIVEADNEDTKGSGRKYFHIKSSKGLSGGAIAAIVISCVAAVAIVGIIAVLMKKNAFGNHKVALSDTSVDNNGTVNKFMYNNEKPNI